MTREQLEKFKNGKAFINMSKTDEFDWLDLMDECMEAGIDLNKRAEEYYNDKISALFGKENVFHSVPPFIYYQNEWNKQFHLLKCVNGDHLSIASYERNPQNELEVYDYECKSVPEFEI